MGMAKIPIKTSWENFTWHGKKVKKKKREK